MNYFPLFLSGIIFLAGMYMWNIEEIDCKIFPTNETTTTCYLKTTAEIISYEYGSICSKKHLNTSLNNYSGCYYYNHLVFKYNGFDVTGMNFEYYYITQHDTYNFKEAIKSLETNIYPILRNSTIYYNLYEPSQINYQRTITPIKDINRTYGRYILVIIFLFIALTFPIVDYEESKNFNEFLNRRRLLNDLERESDDDFKSESEQNSESEQDSENESKGSTTLSEKSSDKSSVEFEQIDNEHVE